MGRRRDRDRRQTATAGGGGSRRMKLDLGDDGNLPGQATGRGLISSSLEPWLTSGAEKEPPSAGGIAEGAQTENPLTLLGLYTEQDDDDALEEDDEIKSTSDIIRSTADVRPAVQVDEQVSNFLAELEDSGLLQDGDQEKPPSVDGETSNEIVAKVSASKTKVKDFDNSPIVVDHVREAPTVTKVDEVSSAEEIHGAGTAVENESEVWEAVMDDVSGLVYYWNKNTGETSWERPASFCTPSRIGEAEMISDVNIIKTREDGLSGDSSSPSRFRTPEEQEPVGVGDSIVAQEEVGTEDDKVFGESETHRKTVMDQVGTGPVHPSSLVGSKPQGNDDVDCVPSTKKLPEQSLRFQDGAMEVEAKRVPPSGEEKGVSDKSYHTASFSERSEGDATRDSEDDGSHGTASVEDQARGRRKEKEERRGERKDDGSHRSASVKEQKEGRREERGVGRGERQDDGSHGTGSVEHMNRGRTEVGVERGERKDRGESRPNVAERWAVMAARLREAAGTDFDLVSQNVRMAIEAELRAADSAEAMGHNLPKEVLWERNLSDLKRFEAREVPSSLKEVAQEVKSEAAVKHIHPNIDRHGIGVKAVKVIFTPSEPVEGNGSPSPSPSPDRQPLGLGMLTMYSDSSAEDGEIRIVVKDPAVRKGKELGIEQEKHDREEKKSIIETDHVNNAKGALVEAECPAEEDMDVEMEIETRAETHNVLQFSMTNMEYPTSSYGNLSGEINSMPEQTNAPLPPLEEFPPPPPPEEEPIYAHPPFPLEGELDFPPPPPPSDYAEGVLWNVEPSISAANLLDPPSLVRPAIGHPSLVSKPVVYSAPPSGPGARVPTGAESALSAAAMAAAAAVTTMKRIETGSIGKKRKVAAAVGNSLKSNKKVSSMLHKWKAAKEELHEEATVPDEFDVEAQEKKKLREIEEWKMQQLVGGSVKQNANFQPLGGSDWRERVKRAKKAAANALTSLKLPGGGTGGEDVEGPTPPEPEPQTTGGKPNLVEISKGLPSGWQAFWDEDSKEVYYGNLSTKETSWDRPS